MTTLVPEGPIIVDSVALTADEVPAHAVMCQLAEDVPNLKEFSVVTKASIAEGVCLKQRLANVFNFAVIM